MTQELVILALGAAVAGFVQGISGFAFGLTAMSIWVWTIEPGVAAVMAVFGGLTGQLVSVARVRRGMHLPILLPFLAGAVVGLPLGVLALPHLDPTSFKLVVGAILLVFCPAMLLVQRVPSIKPAGRTGDVIAGAIGGAMGGIGGFTGAAPALWCTLRGYDRDAHRAVLQNFNLVALAATMVAMLLSGAVRAEMLPGFAVVAPALVIPSLIGSKVYLGLSTQQFRRIVLLLLSVSGLVMVSASFRTVLFGPS